VLAAGAVLAMVGQICTVPARAADTYELRRDALVVTSFAADHCSATVSVLDSRSFAELNQLTGPKIIDNPGGWSVEARTGGRPFLCLDEISVGSAPVPFDPAGFGPGTSGIPQSELDAHFALGKTVNRLWLTHEADGGYPIVVVLTPDGFLNLAGAEAPRLLGAAVRTGFIGPPFAAYDGQEELEQHLERLDITVVDDAALVLLLDVHSEAGEGVLELELRWDPAFEQPILRARSARLPDETTRLGLAGLDLLRGPTLYGLLDVCGSYSGGIEAFHDGRSVLVRRPGEPIVQSLLVPPVSTSEVVRDDLASDIGVGTRIMMDQPQGATGYFSKHPAVAYEDRADLVLRLLASTSSTVTVERAQVSVDLADPNPEANETVNVLLAVPSTALQLEQHAFEVTLGAEDIEAGFSEVLRGVVYVASGSLYFLPLDADHAPAGPARPLTDAVITDPRRPAVSADGRLVIFDADGSSSETRQRVFLLDLLRGTVRRLTVDPTGTSNDMAPSLSGDGTRFAMATSRRGSLVIDRESVATGYSCGSGASTLPGADADWSHARNELAVTSGTALSLFDDGTSISTPLVARAGARSPAFSPDGNQIAYAADTGLYVVHRDGTGDAQVLGDGEHPTWADDDTLIVHRTVSSETDLWVVDVATGAADQLTPADGVDCLEPAHVLWLPTCTGDPAEGDSDSDGICNNQDICEGDDALGDSDADGTCDDLDQCLGHDDTIDLDGDGVPDGCDACAGADVSGDSDADGTCDDIDLCPGHDDGLDVDADGIPDGCDLCRGDNATGDADSDGTCDDLDCNDSNPGAADIDPCGICGGDGSSCRIFTDGFESGDMMRWSVSAP